MKTARHDPRRRVWCRLVVHNTPPSIGNSAARHGLPKCNAISASPQRSSHGPVWRPEGQTLGGNFKHRRQLRAGAGPPDAPFSWTEPPQHPDSSVGAVGVLGLGLPRLITGQVERRNGAAMLKPGIKGRLAARMGGPISILLRLVLAFSLVPVQQVTDPAFECCKSVPCWSRV